jgi:outer membrane protein assembly factor BamB
MRRKIDVSFVLITLFLFSIFHMSTFSGAADSHGGSGFLGPQLTIDSWPMFHHDLNHTGYSTSTAPNTNQTLWNQTTSGAVKSSPAVAGGMVYVGSLDHQVYALDISTGAKLWNYTTGGGWSSPAVAGGMVYVGSLDGKVYALNISTGAKLWNYTTGDRVFSSPAVAGGIVFVGSGDKNVYALDAFTGVLVWNYTTGSYVESSPAVNNGTVFVGSEDHNVYALDASTGAVVWNRTIGGSVYESSPAVADGIVFVGSGDKNVYALNASTGAVVWSYTTGDYVYSSPAVADGTVFVGSDNGKVYAFGPPPYNVAVKAHCIAEVADVSVQIAMDGSLAGYTTPHTFTGLMGSHTFTIPDTDASGHTFNQWSTGETGTTITITSSGTYTAYYQDMWPTFHHDLNHTGYSTSTAPNTNETLWSYRTGGYVYSSPAVADGMVFVGSRDKNVYALDAFTGVLVWNYTTGDLVVSSPAVAGGMVYVGSDDGNVYALDAFTGVLVWNYTTGDLVGSSPAVAGGTVFVGSWDHNVYALDAFTGVLVWNYTTGSMVESSPAVNKDMVYVGSDDGNVYALDAFTGALVWNYTTSSPVSSSPAVAGGMVYVGSRYNVYALDASTGSFKWSNTTGGYVLSSPAVAGGKVYVGSFDGKVYGLNASTGTYLWSYTTGSVVQSSPAVADGKVFVGSWDHNVYALDASTGSFKWSYTTGVAVESSPAVADGMVFVGSGDHKVYAFGVHDLAVTNVTSPKTVVGQGFTADVNVTVANHGRYTETFNVTAYAYSSNLLGFKKPITITGSGDTLTDYQVLLTMDTTSLISAGKMRPDCGDMRFRDPAGSQIPYWIEPGTENSSNTRVWVKVPNIPSSGNTTIYMTYGNPTLSSASNGTATFSFFDDFKSLDTTKWNVTASGNAKASVSNGELVLNASGGSPSGDSVSVILKSTWQGSYIIGTKARRLFVPDESQTGIIWRVNETGDWYGNEHWIYQCYYNGSDSAYLIMSNDTGFTGAGLTSVPISSAGVTGYIKRDYPEKNYYSVVDGTQQGGSLNEVTDGGWTTVRDTNRVGINANNYYSVPKFDFRYDWFFVANYSLPEPTIYVGEEQPVQTIAWQTITLSSGNSANITFPWNTAGFLYGNYTISAYAWPVPGETNTADNNCTGAFVFVAGQGDLTGHDPQNALDFAPDGRVDITDVAVVAKFFSQKVPPAPANCDVSGIMGIGLPDGKIDITDVATVAKNYGNFYPYPP